MLLPFAVTMNTVLIDASLALMALVLGFFAALWYLKLTSPQSSELLEEDLLDKEAQLNDAERANMAAMQLRDLAKNVATDVGAHNTLMVGISEELASRTSGSDVSLVVDRILAANEKLQARLADAEQKIQSQAEEIRAQQSEAMTDSLTKLANRRAFDEAIAKNIAAFHATRRPFSLMIFDVDHFKDFNDTHGHQAGDEVLRRVASTLTETVKTIDIPCRYGGEEFALVMPNTKIDSARVAAERVRKAIEGMIVIFEGKTLHVTASMGVAEMTQRDDETKLIRRSDDCVYAAKAAGRNQTYWNNGSQCLSHHGPLPKILAPTKVTGAKHARGSALDGELPSREVFTSELQRRIAESHRFGVSLSVMHIHLNGYEELEQEYGEAVGHMLLDSVAQFIRGSLRDMDLLGQLTRGGFIVMLPGSTEKEATIVGGRVQTAISNCTIPLGRRDLKLDVAHGVTGVYPDDDAKSMIERAKETMKKAQVTAAVS